MINWLVKWGVKKWLVGVVNTALVEYADKVEKARAFVSAAISKVEEVTAFLKSLDAKLADGKITEAEAESAIQEAANLGAILVSKEG